jgi:hypothetical protein
MNTDDKIKKLEDDIAFLTGEIADLRRNISRLRKAPSVYAHPEYVHESEEEHTS